MTGKRPQRPDPSRRHRTSKSLNERLSRGADFADAPAVDVQESEPAEDDEDAGETSEETE